MIRITKINDDGSISILLGKKVPFPERRGYAEDLAFGKLAAYEDAEEAGYIKRCPNCGGFNWTEQDFFGFANSSFKKCNDCKEEFQ